MIASPVSAAHTCAITVYPPLKVALTPVPQGSYAEYSCDAGYLLVGSSTRYCNTVPALEGVEPTCSLACPMLSTLSPLSVSVSALTYASNGVATYTCAAGYSLSGSSTRTCQSDGTWSGMAPTCSVVTCPNLTAITPLFVTVSAHTYISNGVATYTCESGYSVTGSDTRTCQADGLWSGSEPTCSIVTCPPLSAAGTLSVNSQKMTYNSVATYSCETGHSMSGSITRICQADGTWSVSEPICSIVTCPPLFTTSPVTVSATNITYNSNATYSCEIGYSMTGFYSRTCQADGTWSGSEPTCSIVTCLAPTPPSQLSVIAPNNSYNSDATYSCEIGYSLSGSDTRTCQADGTWNGSEPTCSIVTCPPLAVTSRLAVSAPNLTYSSNATYSCSVGYEIIGNSTRTCQNDGTWSESEPTCTPITCSNITAPLNGQINFPSGFGVGGHAVFGCNLGYILSDNRMATCTVAGTWDIARPTCLYNGIKRFILMVTLLNQNITFADGSSSSYTL